MLDKVLIFISLVSTPAVTRVADSKIDLECGRTDVAEFKCLDGKACFQFQYLCDGVYDCADGSDESACTDGLTENPDGAKLILLHRVKRQEQLSNCRKNQWRCQDGTCISFDGKCDGVVNCPDRSDETLPLCRNMPCQANWFRCTYGACVDGTAPCNGIQECADNSDELLPRCRNQTMEVKGKFRCKDGTTIDSSDLCDGKNDCLDKSDEVLEACANRVCPSYLFQCAYGACVDRGADCDGIADCADGSDESSELCNRIGKPHVIEAPTPGVSKPGFCILPSYPPHGHYTVANVADARPGQTAISYVVNVTCHPGYGIMNDTDISKTIYCVSGIWYSSFPQCVRYCKLHEDPSVNYFCRVGKTDGFTKCPEAISPGTTVKPVCNTPNYYSPEALAYMNCIDGSFDKVITCKPGLAKNGTNITILITDKVEVYISGFSYGGTNVTINVDSTNNSVVVESNSDVVTTANPINSEISEDDWRMRPFVKNNKNMKTKLKNKAHM